MEIFNFFFLFRPLTTDNPIIFYGSNRMKVYEKYKRAHLVGFLGWVGPLIYLSQSSQRLLYKDRSSNKKFQRYTVFGRDLQIKS